MKHKNLRFNKKSQAAIEFLMTYGWMLLVVLIVGALIFSFVDFGSLLPSQVDVSPPLRGDSTLVSAEAGTSGNAGTIQFIMTYINAKGSTIAYDSDSMSLTSDLSSIVCTNEELYNVDTGTTATSSTPINVINGHKIRVKFSCTNLIPDDVFEGEARFKVKDTRTSFETTSKGRIRVSVD